MGMSPGKSALFPPLSHISFQPRERQLHPMGTCSVHITALLLLRALAGPRDRLLGGSFWGGEVRLAGGALHCTAWRGLPEARALPGSWRAARVSRRCARRRAGCSAAAGTPGWPSRCSGPFGIRQRTPNRNRTVGDDGSAPALGTAALGARMGMAGAQGFWEGGGGKCREEDGWHPGLVCAGRAWGTRGFCALCCPGGQKDCNACGSLRCQRG